MNALDYGLILAYLALLLGLGYVYREQHDRKDYFLGGRAFGWLPLTLSTMATQLSAISFISAPAFVGIRAGGGMIWLSYELAVPLAMIILMWGIMPRLYQSGYVSIYEFLEARFDQYTRFLISIVFQVSRAFGTGITIYAVALILQSMVGLPLWLAIVIIGVVTALYSLSGGMKAVVFGDALQMVIIFLGIFLCTAFALYELGGLKPLFAHLDPARLTAVNFRSLGLDGDEFGFWPMLFGGLVLYASYYGCDQTQAQRILSAKNETTVWRILFANGLMRFPMVLLYCLMGLIIGTLAITAPDFPTDGMAQRPDLLVPRFIVTYMPHGLIGILVVAILSAAMSSLSSVINSLTAVTIEDVARVRGKSMSEGQYVFWSRFAALAWSAVILVLSFYGGAIASTVIEAVNKVGSLFYGPILATFVLAILWRGVGPMAANAGLLGGVGINLYLWLGQPQVFWFWWNVSGFAGALAIAWLVAAVLRHREPALALASVIHEDNIASLRRQTLILAFYFVFILLFISSFPRLWAWLAASLGAA